MPKYIFSRLLVTELPDIFPYSTKETIIEANNSTKSRPCTKEKSCQASNFSLQEWVSSVTLFVTAAVEVIFDFFVVHFCVV